MCLTDLQIGQKGKVQYIDDICLNKKRLEELGFSENSEIIPLHISMGGSITAYWVKGAVMALRKEDSDCIEIEFVEGCYD